MGNVEENWRWESVLSPNSSSEVDIGQDIYYYVLFVSVDYSPYDEIWQIIQNLTRLSMLGYRAAISPGIRMDGPYPDHLTIIVDTPLIKKTMVMERFIQSGLSNYVRYWKRRPRFKQNEDPVDPYGPPRTRSEILETY